MEKVVKHKRHRTTEVERLTNVYQSKPLLAKPANLYTAVVDSIGYVVTEQGILKMIVDYCQEPSIVVNLGSIYQSLRIEFFGDPVGIGKGCWVYSPEFFYPLSQVRILGYGNSDALRAFQNCQNKGEHIGLKFYQSRLKYHGDVSSVRFGVQTSTILYSVNSSEVHQFPKGIYTRRWGSKNMIYFDKSFDHTYQNID
jgi:hypothetical protein